MKGRQDRMSVKDMGRERVPVEGARRKGEAATREIGAGERIPERMWTIVKATFVGFGRHEGPLRAAALAYYVLLSLFPLLLFLIFLGSLLLASEDVRGELDGYLLVVLPNVRSNLNAIIDQTLQSRGSIGIISAVGLIWSASALFTNLEASVNVIWGAPNRVVWRRRALALLSVMVIGSLFVLSILLNTLPVISLLDRTKPIWRTLDLSLGIAVTMLLFWLVYRWIPNCQVRYQPTIVGALFAGVLWEVAQIAFSWYLTSGFSNYGAVYGSLAYVITLVIRAYLGGLILYLGAELSAQLQKHIWLPKGKEKASSL